MHSSKFPEVTKILTEVARFASDFVTIVAFYTIATVIAHTIPSIIVVSNIIIP